MLRTRLCLHGYPVSNYFNVARAALIEKRLSFDVVIVRAAQDEPFLAMNPMGKIPVLEAEGRFIAETVAILEYLDDQYPEPSLRPADFMIRAHGRQIVNIIQMYVEAPIRSLFPGVFFGATNLPHTVTGVQTVLDRAIRALACLLKPSPFLLGPSLSQADLFAFYNLDIADRVTRFVYGRSIRNDIGTLGQWHATMLDRSSSQIVLADFEQYFARYLADHNAAYDPKVKITDFAGASGVLSHA
jgi:glutathione S-transferase